MNDSHPDALDITAKSLVTMLGGTWQGDVAYCHCPAHDDVARSLKVSVGADALRLDCLAGCARSLVSSAIADRYDVRDGDCAALRRLSEQEERLRARAIWDNSVPLKGSVAETYLRSLKIDFLPPELRFCRAGSICTGTEHALYPALVAAVRDQCGLTAVHCTFLRDDGLGRADIASPQTSVGDLGGGLGCWGGAPHKILRLANEAEDAASAMITATHGIPIWPVFSAKRYGVIEIGETIKHVIVYTDRSAQTAQLLQRAVPHLTANGRTLEFVRPPIDGSWSDWLRRILA